MHSDYRIPELQGLRDQIARFSRRERKLEALDRAEQLLNELDPGRTYTFHFLFFRITSYRPGDAADRPVSGEEARHDLGRFIEDISDSADIRTDEVPDRVFTVDQLSKSLNVSTKTIFRWRRLGLVSRRFVFDGRKRVGFLGSSVERFVAQNRDKVRRGERFSQLTAENRQEIIDRARRMAHAGGGPADVARRIAKKMRRSVETIRYTLKQYDAGHPDSAVFPSHAGRLPDEMKSRIYKLYRMDVSPDVLARQFRRTRSSIHRIVNEARARSILREPLDYMPNDEFDQDGADKRILGPTPVSSEKARRTRVPDGLPNYLARLYDVPLLTREQEYHLFRRFNFLKHRAVQLREGLDPITAKASAMDRVEKLIDAARSAKNQIVKANLRLVVSIAKRHVSGADDFFGLVSDGNMSLIRAVEKFDYSRGNKFSTYASWAIMKNFARTIPEEFKHRDRFRTSQEELFGAREDERSDEYEQESAQSMRQRQIAHILTHLDEREREIIISRFGLDYNQEPRTLKEVGAELNVTKERVRQIEARALNKLRAAAHEEKIELPD